MYSLIDFVDTNRNPDSGLFSKQERPDNIGSHQSVVCVNDQVTGVDRDGFANQRQSRRVDIGRCDRSGKTKVSRLHASLHDTQIVKVRIGLDSNVIVGVDQGRVADFGDTGVIGQRDDRDATDRLCTAHTKRIDELLEYILRLFGFSAQRLQQSLDAQVDRRHLARFDDGSGDF